jgi:hypothetical protein
LAGLCVVGNSFFDYDAFKFDPRRAATGWYVLVTCPNGAHVELHDFHSEAGAKAWIRVSAKHWIQDYLKLTDLPTAIRH